MEWGAQEEAVAAYQRAYELRPSEWTIVGNFGLALAEVGRHTEAERIILNRAPALAHYSEATGEGRARHERLREAAGEKLLDQAIALEILDRQAERDSRSCALQRGREKTPRVLHADGCRATFSISRTIGFSSCP
jgi:tetratricopeptide (TPR) repeat protein